jgi:hypothetical protein
MSAAPAMDETMIIVVSALADALKGDVILKVYLPPG